MPRRQTANKEGRRAALYFAAFIGFVLLASSPYGESVENVLVYPGIAVILLLSAVSLYSWWRNQSERPPAEEDSRWWKHIQDLLRFPW